jgi:hypothetical protein
MQYRTRLDEVEASSGVLEWHSGGCRNHRSGRFVEEMKTWVDASYVVHMDMKSHMGGVVFFGIRAVMGKSSKQKLNTKSSMEAELVVASDYLPHAIWARKLLQKQGYAIKQKHILPGQSECNTI